MLFFLSTPTETHESRVLHRLREEQQTTRGCNQSVYDNYTESFMQDMPYYASFVSCMDHNLLDYANNQWRKKEHTIE